MTISLDKYFIKVYKQASIFSLVHSALRKDVNNVSIFEDIGICKLNYINNYHDLLKLQFDRYLVWSNPNKEGQSDWYDIDTNNYLLSDYVLGLLGGKIKPPAKLLKTIESLKKGLNKPIEILTAYDTELNKGIIIDGTKRIIALSYLSSKYCKILFPCDYFKSIIKEHRA